MTPFTPSLPYATRPPLGAAAVAWLRALETALPSSLVGLWAARGQGIWVMDEGETPRVALGHFFWRSVQGRGALYLPPTCSPLVAWEVAGAWLDHLSGSLGGPPRLSEGHGATPTLQEAATHLASILARGYAAELLVTDETPLLFARAIAWHHLTPRPLSAVDPHLARWLRATLFSEGFWRQVAREVEEREK